MSILKKLLNPTFIFALIIVVAVVAGLLAFGNLQKVIGLMERFDRIYLLWFFLLMIGYTVVRGLQWHYLLRQLGTKAPIRSQIFAFLIGEITKSLPIGNYMQNYVLQRTQDEDFGRTSAASTLIILTEVCVSVLGVDIIGLGKWGWLRPLITFGTVFAAMGAWFIIDSHEEGQPPQWISKHKLFMRALGEIRQFKEGVGVLMKPRTVLIESALSATYLMMAGGALYVVLLGLHVTNIDFFTTLSVYFFSLAISLMLPLPVDFGAVEVSGTGAFLAVGLARYAAVSVMLINRVLSLLSAFAIAFVGIALMPDELHAVLTRKPHDERRPSTKRKPQNHEDAPTHEAQPTDSSPHTPHTPPDTDGDAAPSNHASDSEEPDLPESTSSAAKASP